MSTPASVFADFPLISSYSRRQALLDGVLIALPRAHLLGFRVPVAITAAAYAATVAWPENDPGCYGRLVERELAVLAAAMSEARALIHRERSGLGDGHGDRIDFALEVLAQDGSGCFNPIALYMVIGPGDDARPVGTILLPGED